MKWLNEWFGMVLAGLLCAGITGTIVTYARAQRNQENIKKVESRVEKLEDSAATRDQQITRTANDVRWIRETLELQYGARRKQ